MKKIIITLLVTLVALTTIGCASKQKAIPEDLTSAQLIQLGQNCYEKNDFEGALRYYREDIQRYGDDIAVYIEAKYEMGHVYLRSSKYEEAYNAFTEILGYYGKMPAGSLPAEYKKLSEICLSQIPEKKLSELENK